MDESGGSASSAEPTWSSWRAPDVARPPWLRTLADNYAQSKRTALGSATVAVVVGILVVVAGVITAIVMLKHTVSTDVGRHHDLVGAGLGLLFGAIAAGTGVALLGAAVRMIALRYRVLDGEVERDASY